MTNTIKTALLLGLLSAVLMGLGEMLGGGQGLIAGFAFAVMMNFGSYWFSDKIVLRMYNAQEVSPDHVLYRITARLAQKAGLPMPRVYIIPDQSPNAFATGRSPEHAAVAATEGILRMLPENELEGVIAHELSHVKHRDTLITTIAAAVASAIMMLANMAKWGAIFGGFGGSRDDREGGSNGLMLIVLAILAPFAAMIIQATISRQREFAADRGGADLTGTPVGLANALRHIDAGAKQIPMDATPATAHMFIMNPFSGEGLANLFRSHPPTEERIRALMERR